MSDVLVSDDPLYKELYDVRREAEALGNLVERDVVPEIHALRAKASVHKGKLRELLGLPDTIRHVLAAGRQHYTVLAYEACEAAFRDPKRFDTTISHTPNEFNEKQLGRWTAPCTGPIAGQSSPSF